MPPPRARHRGWGRRLRGGGSGSPAGPGGTQALSAPWQHRTGGRARRFAGSSRREGLVRPVSSCFRPRGKAVVARGAFPRGSGAIRAGEAAGEGPPRCPGCGGGPAALVLAAPWALERVPSPLCAGPGAWGPPECHVQRGARRVVKARVALLKQPGEQGQFSSWARLSQHLPPARASFLPGLSPICMPVPFRSGPVGCTPYPPLCSFCSLAVRELSVPGCPWKTNNEIVMRGGS